MAHVSFEQISTFVFDVDGVLTDGTILVLENGLQARRMSIRDGYALQLAVRKGYRVLVISGAAASPVVDRLNKLGITEVHMGIRDKWDFLRQYLHTQAIPVAEVLFMGDDMPDYEIMTKVALPVCPADAIEDIAAISRYRSHLPGGGGCVRDVIEKVMRSRGHWLHESTVSSR